MTTIKGYTRQYRKALKGNGYKGFPLRGAFHVTSNGNPVSATDIKPGLTLAYVAGPIPSNPPYVQPFTLPPVVSKPDNSPPPITLPTMYRRTERVGKDGENTKKRVDYKPVANPKPDTLYWYKPEGSKKYVEVNYSKLLSDLEAAAIAA